MALDFPDRPGAAEAFATVRPHLIDGARTATAKHVRHDDESVIVRNRHWTLEIVVRVEQSIRSFKSKPLDTCRQRREERGAICWWKQNAVIGERSVENDLIADYADAHRWRFPGLTMSDDTTVGENSCRCPDLVPNHVEMLLQRKRIP